MQIGLLTVAVRLLREEFKRKGNTPLGLIWEVWVTLIKWEEGTKDAWRMTPGSRMLHQDWSGQNFTGGGNFYFCGFLNHLDFSSSFPLTLAQVFIDFSTESESPLPRLTAGVPITVSIQLWPTGSYSLCKYLSSPCEILSTTQDTWGMSRREWFQGVQCVAFFIFKRKTTDLFTFGHVGP